MTTQGSTPGVPGFSATGGSSSGGPASAGQPDFGGHSLTVPEPAPAREFGRVPSPQGLRRGMAVAIGRDAQGNQVTYEGQPGDDPFGMPGGHKSGGRISFRSAASGKAVLSRNASEGDLVVDAEGNVLSDLGSLLNAGLIEETESGGYRLVGAEPEGAQGGQQGDPMAETERAAQDAAAKQVPFENAQIEGWVQHLQSEHTSLYAGISEIMSSPNFDGILPAHILESAARQLNVSTDQARAALAHIAGEFQQQAIRYISDAGIDYNSLQNWLRSDNGADKETRELLAKAMKAHSQDRSLEGYDLVISRFLATLARDHPESLLKQLEGVANVRRDNSTGAVLVDIPDKGTTSFEAAARWDLLNEWRRQP